MLKVLKILVTAHALVGGAAMLSACGQKGPLVLPSSPESAERATLTETLTPWRTRVVPSAPGVRPANAAAPKPAPSNAPITPSQTAPSAPTALTP